MATSSESKFDQTWTPRIGPQGASELRRNGILTLTIAPSIFGLAILSSDLFGSGSLHNPILGAVAVVVAFALGTVWVRSRLRLTREVSSWFATNLRWFELPNFREKQFDSWCRRRGLSHSN